MTHVPDDDDDGLPPHLQRLLRDGADGPPLAEEASQRLLGRVLVSVGAVGAAGGSLSASASQASQAATAAPGAASSTTAASAATGVGVAVKAAALAGALAVVGVVGVVVTRPPTVDVPVTAFAPVVDVPSRVAVDMPQPPSPSPPPPQQPSPTPTAPTPAPPMKRPLPGPAPSAMAAAWEVPALEAARAALSEGRADEALRLVEDHAARAPSSPLREEAAAIRVIALARAGRVEEARASATVFLATYPQSLFGARVQRAVQGQ